MSHRSPATPYTAARRDGRSFHRTARGTALAAEAGERYDTGVDRIPTDRDAPRGGCPHRADTARDAAAPFGLPVLGEVPALADVLTELAAADVHLLSAVATLADLHASSEAESRTGVPLEHWLGLVVRQTRMDRRLLLRCCRLLQRLPALRRAVDEQRISFAQLRGLSIELRDLPVAHDTAVDAELGRLLETLGELERPDPDVLIRRIADARTELDQSALEAAEAGAHADRFLHIQPRLDRTGGRFSGELDAPGLALLDAATVPSAAVLDAAPGFGAARADTLLARLAASGTHARVDGAETDTGDRHAPGQRGPGGDRQAGWLDDLAPPRLLVRLPLRTLLDDEAPADLVTQLVGGRLRLTSSAARRLLDERGCSLRAVVVDDDGTVLGVGRSTRRPPGWLSDVQLAVHDTCTGPLCDQPARGAQTDHAIPWWPNGPDEVPGGTDVDNVGPLCPATNRRKEAAGWRVRQTGAGVRTWVHTRSGLTCTSLPTTWRPAGGRDGPGRPPPRSAPPDDTVDGPTPPGLPF